MTDKWRPSLWFVLAGALTGTLGLSLAGLVALRYLGPDIGFRPAAALLAAGIGLATLGLGVLLVRLLLGPMTELSRRAKAVSTGEADSTRPLQHYGTKELHRLGQSVLEMARTLQRREASVRSFADHVTHELKTPVSAIHAAVELLEDSPDLAPEDRQLLSQIQGAARQMQTQLDALNRVTRARAPMHHGRSRVLDLGPALHAAHLDVSLMIGETDVLLPLNAEGLMAVLTQLIDNSVQHGASRVDIKTTQEHGAVIVDVRDDGPGISPGNRDQVFDAFFTSRRDSGGTGMGLTIVRNLLHAHSARIELLPSDVGAWFRITFDAVD